MADLNTRIKNRIYKTHDLKTLWVKLRKEGLLVWEDEDYTDNAQAPYHLMHIEEETTGCRFVADTLYRDRTEQELAEDRELGITPFKQEIEWVKY